MTSSRLNGVTAVLSAILLAGGCGPGVQDDPTTANVGQPAEPLHGCSHTAQPMGTGCDDRNGSTGKDACAEGMCSGTVLLMDDPGTPGDDRAGWVTCADGSICQDRCCRVNGPTLPWVCSTGGLCPGNQWGQSACDGPEDCAHGQVCCPGSDNVSCQVSCPFGPLCHTDQDCPTGQVCGQSVAPWAQCVPRPVG